MRVSQEPEAAVDPAKKNPDIDSISFLKLYEGKRVKHELIYGVVKSRNTGLFHHDYANFKTYRKRKNQPWKLDQAASFTLSEDRERSLSEALHFLQQMRQAAQPGTAIAPAKAPDKLSASESTVVESTHSDLTDSLQLWQAIAALSPAEQMELSLTVFEGLKQTMPLAECVSLLQATVQAEHLQDAQELFQVAQWRAALKALKQLIQSQASTTVLAEFIQRQSWLLGSNGLAYRSEKLLVQEAASNLQLLHFDDPYGEMIVGLGPLDLSLFETAGQEPVPAPALFQLISDYQLALLKQPLPSQNQPVKRYLLIVGSGLEPAAEASLLRYQALIQPISLITYSEFYLRAGQLLKNLQTRVKSRQSAV